MVVASPQSWREPPGGSTTVVGAYDSGMKNVGDGATGVGACLGGM